MPDGSKTSNDVGAYGVETCSIKKAQEKNLYVMGVSMSRWMCGVTKLDRIRNERIRGTANSDGRNIPECAGT